MGEPNTTLRIFGSLRPLFDERGLSYTQEIELPEAGMSAKELAAKLDIPRDMIEGVFVNHRVHGVGYRVMPGDRIAFVPYGTPGPHRVYLGLYAAGKDEDA